MVNQQERAYLQDLAKKQMEYANAPITQKRKTQWTSLNSGKKTKPMVVVETDTFLIQMMPPEVYRCESDETRAIEHVLLKNIREYELILDDKVVPGFFPIPIAMDIDEFGFTIDKNHSTDSHGRNIGFNYSHPLANITEGFHALKPATIHHNSVETNKRLELANELIGDVIPVIPYGHPPLIKLMEKAVQLMGMEQFFISFYEEPEAVHMLMKYLMNNQITIMKYYEEMNLLTHNSGNFESGASSPTFEENSPRAGTLGKLKDIWMWAEAQENATISADTYNEFCLPYYSQICRLIGNVYYGCCEPVHENWSRILKEIPNIRKVSISAWCNQQIMGDNLKNTNIVFSRKPSPNFLGVDDILNEDGWREHIAETLSAAKDCQCEIIMRDVYKVRDLETVARSVAIVREEIEKI